MDVKVFNLVAVPLGFKIDNLHTHVKIPAHVHFSCL